MKSSPWPRWQKSTERPFCSAAAMGPLQLRVFLGADQTWWFTVRRPVQGPENYFKCMSGFSKVGHAKQAARKAAAAALGKLRIELSAKEGDMDNAQQAPKKHAWKIVKDADGERIWSLDVGPVALRVFVGPDGTWCYTVRRSKPSYYRYENAYASRRGAMFAAHHALRRGSMVCGQAGGTSGVETLPGRGPK